MAWRHTGQVPPIILLRSTQASGLAFGPELLGQTFPDPRSYLVPNITDNPTAKQSKSFKHQTLMQNSVYDSSGISGQWC